MRLRFHMFGTCNTTMSCTTVPAPLHLISALIMCAKSFAVVLEHDLGMCLSCGVLVVTAATIHHMCPATYSTVCLLVPLYLICSSIFSGYIPSLTVALMIGPVTVGVIGGAMSVCLHRYFAHRAFETDRITQCCLGIFACLAFQGPPLWWAAMHSKHHTFCDAPQDPHSVSQQGFGYAFLGWMLNPINYVESPFASRRIQALFDTPEMRAVEALFFVPPIFACCCGAWAFGYHTMLLLVLLPMVLCRLITTLFNVEYHPVNPSKTMCKSVDNARFLARIVGESQHESHHTHPRRAYRRDWDLPYWMMLWPLNLAGVIWNCQV